MNFWIFVCFSVFQLTVCTKEVIKDGRFRNWMRTIFTLYGTGDTFKDKGEGYRTCANGNEFEAWLLTHTLNTNQTLHDVKLYIEVESQMEPCENVNGNCFKDAFELFRYNGDGTPEVPFEPEKSSDEAVKKKAREFFQSNFTYIGNITGNSTSKEIMDTTFTLNLKQFRTITLGIKSRGSCGTVIRMKVYYIVCKETFINSVMYGKTLAPQNGTKVVFGTCSANSRVDLISSNLTAFCQSNGSWSTEGEIVCRCKEGYESLERGCSACRSGWYKSSVSNTKCTKCPTNTVSAKDNTNCECKDGHYRLPSHSTTPHPCYAPIKIPVKPKVKEIKGSRNSVNITWLPPVNNSVNETIVYEIKLSYNPSQVNITKTYVRVSNLIHGQCYQFGIVATNSLNRVISKDKWDFVSSDPYTFQSKVNAATVASNTSNRIIIIVTSVNAGFLVGIVLIVVLIELKRQKRSPRLPAPVDIPLERAETSPSPLQLPVYQEPDYEVARVVANDEELYQIISQYEAYEEPNLSTQNPGYAELDRSLRGNSENDDYQKLQWPDLDYVIP